MTRPVPPAVDLLGWGWVLSVALPAVVHPAAASPGAAAAVALGTVGYRVAARVRPDAPELRGVLWLCGPLVALAVLAVAQPAAPQLAALSLAGAAAAAAGLTLPVPVAVGALVVLQAWSAAWLGLGPTPVDGVLLVETLLVAGASCAAAALVARAIRTGHDRVDGIVAGWLADRRTLRADRARDRALRETRAELHDTVLATLTAVGGGWLRGVDPAELRGEFARTAAVLAGPGPVPAGRVDLLEAIRVTAASPRFAGLRVDTAGTGPLDVAGPVADAVRLAAGEALTNVRRHAGVDRALVRVTGSGGRVRVVVRDDGRGLPAGPTSGLGLPDSVGSRMTGVGGTSEVREVPGGGTEVVLDAPVDPPAPGPVLPSLWSTAGPLAAARWLTVVTLLTGSAAVALEGMAVPAALLPGVACLALVTSPPSGRWSAALVALVGVAGPVAVLLQAHSVAACAELAVPPLTVALAALAAGLVLALLRPARTAVAWAAVTVAAYLAVPWLAGDPGPACAAAGPSLAALHAAQVGAAVLVVAALRARAEDGRRALLAAESLADHAQDAALRDDVRGRLLPVVATAVRQTLTGLAAGELTPEDPAVRRRCQRDARLIRTLLADVLDGDEVVGALVERAVAARAHGVDLAVQGGLPAGSTSAAQRAAVLAVFDGVLATLTAGGWAGEGEVTAVSTAGGAVVTLVAHGVPAGLARAASPTEGTGGALHAEVVDGTLWVTHRSDVHGETA